MFPGSKESYFLKQLFIMNLDEIKKRMDRLNGKSSGSSNGKDYKSVFWKPQEGETNYVRIVPYKHNNDIPFTELYFYFGIDKPRMISLTNFGEADPIQEFINKLRKEGDDSNKELAKKLYPKFRVFAPVVVRGEEDKGVRFWEFGKMVYQELLGVMMDEDWGDITDLTKGHDIKVEKISAKESGKIYPVTTVRVKPKPSALSDDADQVQSFLDNQENITEFFTRFEYDDMKESLRKFINAGDDTEKEEINHTGKAPSTKQSIEDKLDDIF